MKISATTIFRAVIVSVPALLFATAEAGEITENVNAGGSFLTSRIDVNMDGEASSWCTLQIKGGLQGSSMQQCINEDVAMPPTQNCPGGVFIVDAQNGIGGGRGVRTFANGTDQLFLALTERDFCLGFDAAEGQDRGVIIGGTGKFAGATGTYEFTYSGKILYGDLGAMPPQIFGSISGTGTFAISLPD